MLLALLALCVLTVAGSADQMDFPSIGAACNIPDDYVVLTTESISRHTEWLSVHGFSEEEMLADWAARGVLLQAWQTSGEACLEIRAVRDQLAIDYHDIDDQTPQTRAAYRADHLNGKDFKAQGYTVDSAEWKKTGQGRFLMLKYKRKTEDGTLYRGFARKTIKNGYTIVLDYQVYGRTLKSGDNTALNKVWDTWSFTAAIAPDSTEAPAADAPAAVLSPVDEGESQASEPAAATAHIKVTVPPPAETNTGKFTVEGTCDAYTHLVGIMIRMMGSEPVIFQADATRRGAFKMAVQLPQEGSWMMTLTAEKDGQVIEEQVLNVTNYQNNLLVVNLDNELPSEMALTGDTLTISGTTVKQTDVQCIVNGRNVKQIRTNNSGKFSFKIDTSTASAYDIALVFSKKNYATRRLTCKATRSLDEGEVRTRALQTAVKPAYTTLTQKTKNYTGRIMTYEMYVVSSEQAGDRWLLFMAQRKTDDGYQDIVVVTMPEEPTFEEGSLHRMYGTLAGTFQVQDSVNGDQYYPCFDLLFWADEE